MTIPVREEGQISDCTDCTGLRGTGGPSVSSEWDSQWSRRQHVQHSEAPPGVPHSTSLSQLRLPHPGVPPVQHRDDGLPRVALLQTGLVTQPPHPLVQRRGPAGHEELSAQTSHPPRRLTLLPLLGGQRQRAVPVRGQGRPGPDRGGQSGGRSLGP